MKYSNNESIENASLEYGNEMDLMFLYKFS